MSVRQLDYLFKPSSIALIGQGRDSEVIVARSLMNAGFDGPILPVDNSRQALEGALTYPDVASLPLSPELAVITAPLATVPALIEQLGGRGVRAAVITGEGRQAPEHNEREALHRSILQAAKPHGLRVLGPGCRALSVPRSGLNASLSHYRPQAGPVAFVTQSNAIAQTALDWGCHHGFGFSFLVSLGEAIDVDFADVLDYLAQDYHTRAILLYLEQVNDARQFMSAARRVARMKPVMVLKPRQPGLDGIDDAVYDAAFRRAGILRVNDRHELFNLVEALTAVKPVDNDRLAILSNSQSLNLLALETLHRYGGRLAQFSEETQNGLEQLVDPIGSPFNPVDLGDQAGAEDYGKALDLLCEDPGVDGIVVIKAPSALSDAVPVAEAIVQRLPRRRPCILTSFVGPAAGEAARRLTIDHQAPTYETADEAVRAFMRLVQYKRNQALLMETPPSMPEEFDPDTETARHLIAQALAYGREQLNEYEAMRLLAAYGIPVVDSRIAMNPGGAAEIAAQFGRPVAIKIMSPDIPNKVQVGGVARFLDTPEVVREAARAMRKRVQELAPAAHIEGFLIQPMEYREGAYAMTLGVRPGGAFGPVIFFGQGGAEAKAIGDIAYGLPPLNMNLAREIMSQTRIYSLLRYSLLRRADLNALALTLIKVSQMVIDLGTIAELEINPLWVNADGVLAIDARVRAVRYVGDPAQRLAIRPYPKELEERFTLPNGAELMLRPILPEDEPALQEQVRRASPEDLRLRFFQPIRKLSHDMAARMTQIDYNCEMALVAVGPGQPGKAEVCGVVRLIADPDNEKAEYAILVDRNMMHLGLGTLMMRRIIGYARGRGIREIYGEVLQENDAMLNLNRALGFSVSVHPDDPSLRHVTLRL